VESKLKTLRALFEPEIRPGNGLEKVIIREKRRLLLDEIATQYLLENSSNVRPFQENSDGQHPGMVFIPAGEAKIGVDNGFASREEPERIVKISGFWIDIYPVTNAQYSQLYHSHIPSPNYADDDIPVVNVSWFDAHKFCSALGKRLPTQEEWEKAARGPESWIYSFGNEFNRSQIHIWPAESPAKVDSYKPNPWGLYQMSGNVWEWTAEVYCHEIEMGRRIYYNLVRGGSWRHCKWGARATMSLCLDLGHRSETVGFRCVCSY